MTILEPLSELSYVFSPFAKYKVSVVQRYCNESPSGSSASPIKITLDPATTGFGSVATLFSIGTPLIIILAVTLEDQKPMSFIALKIILCEPRCKEDVLNEADSDIIVSMPLKFETHW